MIANGHVVTSHKMTDRVKILCDDIHQVFEVRANLLAKELCNDCANKLFGGDSVSQTSSAEAKPSSKATQLTCNSTQRQTIRDGDPAEKKFHTRPSLLTQLLESDHIKTIYYIFTAVLILLIMSRMVNDLMERGTLDIRFDLIRWSFGGLPILITTWISMFLSTIAVYVVFQSWASLGDNVWINWFFLAVYVAYQLCLFVIPIQYVLLHKFPVASSLIVGCEQARLIMKVHAFVRENVPKALAIKRTAMIKKNDEISAAESSRDEPQESSACVLKLPAFDRYLYFLFAPTLVYRDAYPRTPSIDWRYVANCFVQVVASIFYCYYIMIHYCLPVFQNFNVDHVTLKSFLSSMFACMLPGALWLLLAFYAVLHSWLNAFAEMLRFGDRMFYKDWWNSTSFGDYYRTWNVVVHDWLYSYVYRDCFWLIGSKNRSGPLVTVFLLSALVHEYIIILALRFFYPVLFVEFFVFGLIIMVATKKSLHRSWNILLWLGLFMGCGLMMCLYSMEWYARQNCAPTYDNNFLDLLVPRSWFCKSKASGGKAANLTDSR